MAVKRSEKTFQLSTLILASLISAFVMFILAWLATNKKPDETEVRELINTKIELEQTRQTPINESVKKINDTLEKVLENQRATQYSVEKLQKDIEHIRMEQDELRKNNK